MGARVQGVSMCVRVGVGTLKVAHIVYVNPSAECERNEQPVKIHTDICNDDKLRRGSSSPAPQRPGQKQKPGQREGPRQTHGPRPRPEPRPRPGPKQVPELRPEPRSRSRSGLRPGPGPHQD